MPNKKYQAFLNESTYALWKINTETGEVSRCHFQGPVNQPNAVCIQFGDGLVSDFPGPKP
jgi:hypothetical protein